MNKEVYQNYLAILQKELIPAMGCTEPISIAYAGALAKKHLNEEVENIELIVSTNIIKNVKSVVVPNTGGLKGIFAAISCGILFGDSDKVLEVISNVTEDKKQYIKEFMDTKLFSLRESKLATPFDLYVKLKGKNHSSEVRIVGEHTNVCLIKCDEKVIFEKEFEHYHEEVTIDRECLNVKDIVHFASIVKLEEIEEVLSRQINCNMAIAKEGLNNNYGARIGQIIMKSQPESILTKAKAYAASASDARMGGCEMPVIINSGSGNQGITLSIPVVVYAQELKKTHEELLRALTISNLITAHLKTGIGRLSAYCGVICAGVGAASGICYLYGGGYDEISHTIVNALAIDSGVICDGAKASCAAKIASAIDAGILGLQMVFNGTEFIDGEGIVSKGVENTIRNVGRLASNGMKKTDQEIIDIMIHNKC